MSKALELAKQLENGWIRWKGQYPVILELQAAEELRRLHEEKTLIEQQSEAYLKALRAALLEVNRLQAEKA